MDGLIEKSPARRPGSLLGKAPRREEPDPLAREEAESYLATIRRHFPEHYEFFPATLRTGARPGEVAALKWEDVDFGRRLLHIRRTFSNRQLGDTKTGDRRTVDLTPEFAEALADLLRRRKEEALRSGRGGVREWIFPNPKRTRPVDFRAIAVSVHRRALAKAGIRYRHLKDLRHTVASIPLSEGAPVLAVSKLLGHRSPKMTLDVYSKWIPQEDARGGGAPGWPKARNWDATGCNQVS